MSELINLLLVEDSEYDAILLTYGLRKEGFELNMVRVQTGQEMLTALSSQKWDAVISDYNLPSFNAFKALEILKQSGQDLPFIIVSGTIGEETAVQLMRSGAHDYLMKGNLNRLAEVLRREIRDARGRTERRRAQVALKESEERYRILVTHAPLISFVIDANGIFTLFEGKGMNAIGVNPGDMVGQSVFSMSELTPIIQEDVRLALMGKSHQRDIQIGGYYFDVHYSPIFDENNRVSHVVGVATDVSERLKAEEKLRSTQAFLDHVLKAIPLGISVFNLLTQKIEFDNAISATLHGMDAESFNNMSDAERSALIHPDDRKNYDQFILNLADLEDGETRTYEVRRIGRDREWRWLKYRFFVFEREEHGKITKLLWVSEDITASKDAEQALQRQLKELTILHNISRAGIQVSTTDELIELVTQEVGNSFYPENFGVLLLEDAETTLRAHPSYRGLTEGIGEIVLLDKSVSGQVVLTGRPRRIPDVSIEPNFVKVTSEIQSELCVPIQTGGVTLGVINAESRQHNFFTDADERLLLTISGQLATFIERIRLFNAEKKRRQEAETLRQATAAITTSLDIDHVLGSILTSLKKVVPFDSASVFLLHGNYLQIVISDGLENPEELFTRTFPAEDPLFQEVLQKRAPIILEDASQDHRFNGYGGTSKVKGWMIAPLITRGEVAGYITLDSYQKSAYNIESGMLAQAFAHQAAAAIENARLFKETQNSLDELNQAYESTIEGWSMAMDLRDKETEGHTLRVTDMTVKLARVMNIEEDLLIHFRRGALLHDIGKMGVPDRILLKPDSLTDEEMLIMRRHPKYAYDMLSKIEYLHTALDIPYCHHERWDGKGYPRGLKGNQIPLAARLFAVIDVWDALTSDRPYRPAWSYKDALGYIKELSGIQFDPEIVENFIEMIDH